MICRVCDREMLYSRLHECRIEPHPTPNAAVPMLLWCPRCERKHIDEHMWETRSHKTHLCRWCKHEWRPFEYATVGVERLPVTEPAKPDPDAAVRAPFTGLASSNPYQDGYDTGFTAGRDEGARDEREALRKKLNDDSMQRRVDGWSQLADELWKQADAIARRGQAGGGT